VTTDYSVRNVSKKKKTDNTRKPEQEDEILAVQEIDVKLEL
jgi:hypothetical protein